MEAATEEVAAAEGRLGVVRMVALLVVGLVGDTPWTSSYSEI